MTTNLSPEQAQHLWNAGGFIICPEMPEGSEYGLDGTSHIVTERFNGTKFVPPGFHLITWSTGSNTGRGKAETGTGAGSSGGSGPGTIPLKTAVVRFTTRRQRLLMRYDSGTEGLVGETDSLISDDHLRSLDPGLAPFSFAGLESWKALTSCLDQVDLDTVLQGGSRLDGMTTVIGEEEDCEEYRNERSNRQEAPSSGDSAVEQTKGMRFVRFRLRRSWRDGAVGEEVTRYSRDKSWLLGHVVKRELSGDPIRLLAQLQLAFILFYHLSNYSTLQVYKRLLPLFTRSKTLQLDPTLFLPHTSTPQVVQLYLQLLGTLSAQLAALPRDCFELELPELDVWYVDELSVLRDNLQAALRSGSPAWAGNEEQLMTAWGELRRVAKQEYSWVLEPLINRSGEAGDVANDEAEDEDEEGEYAPVVVET